MFWKHDEEVLKKSYFCHDRGPYHIETSPMICRDDQWTGFYMIGISVMKEFSHPIITFTTEYSEEKAIFWIFSCNSQK